ncbi:zinc-ribbon domain-containing protein, partial [Candidatus Margulisiibacteriota bacterium]
MPTKKPKPGKSLAEINPKLAKEWHPTKNGRVNPYDVVANSHRKVWWKCYKGDDHVWRASVANRNRGDGCPFCSNHKVCKSNCLATINPKLAKEWHPAKNGKLTPFNVVAGSGKKAWWKCPKGNDHEWKAVIVSRAKNNNGCPYCSGRYADKNNNLEKSNPKLAKEWHPIKNGDLTPQNVVPGSTKKVWWKCAKGDDHEWKATIKSRSEGNGCAVCDNKVAVKSNCLATLNPKLAKEWHPTKNGNLTPNDIVVGSHKRVWWKCPKGDDHEWKASVKDRNVGRGCGICAGKIVVKSNSLATLNPVLAREWHPTKNGNLIPQNVVPGSNKNIWWKCPKGDDHEWKAKINDRNRGDGCPICSNQKVVKSNSLATLNTELAKEWHPTKNGKSSPFNIGPGSNKKVWWKCKYGHEWKTAVAKRTEGTGCPKCNPPTSVPELRIFSELKSIFPSTQHRAILKGYEVDIYIPELKLGI